MATQKESEGGTPVGEQGGPDEVRGRTVLQVVEAMPDAAEDEARETLAEMGIEDPTPDGWYPHSAWVDTIRAIGNRIGRATVEHVGETVVRTIEWPDGTERFRDGLEVVDRAYRANHRGGDLGGYEWTPGEDDETLVVCRTDHPAAYDEAVVRATARAFPDEGVSRVAEVTDEADDAGDTVYEVSWWSFSE